MHNKIKRKYNIEKIFILSQIVSVSFHKTMKRSDLFKWVKRTKYKGFWFWRKKIEYYEWNDGNSDVFDNHFSTDEELLKYFKTYIGRDDMFIKDKVLYQKPYVKMILANDGHLNKVFSDDVLAEQYYTSVKAELSRCGIPYRDLSKDLL